MPISIALVTFALALGDGGPPTPSPTADAGGGPTTATAQVALAPDAGSATPTAPAATPDAGVPGGAILAEVVGLHNDKGLVGCALWNTEKGFPGDAPKALQYEFPKPDGRRAICRFEGYPAGTYAIVVYHDENSNHTLDQGFLGVPTEGWGASNDARAFMAPPSFSKAKFEYPGQVFKVLIHMSY